MMIRQWLWSKGRCWNCWLEGSKADGGRSAPLCLWHGAGIGIRVGGKAVSLEGEEATDGGWGPAGCIRKSSACNATLRACPPARVASRSTNPSLGTSAKHRGSCPGCLNPQSSAGSSLWQPEGSRQAFLRDLVVSLEQERGPWHFLGVCALSRRQELGACWARLLVLVEEAGLLKHSF